MTSLMMAAKAGHYQCIVSLMTRGASLNVGDNNGYTAIHFAARQGHKDVVEYLVEAGGAVELRDTILGEVKQSQVIAVKVFA